MSDLLLDGAAAAADDDGDDDDDDDRHSIVLRLKFHLLLKLCIQHAICLQACCVNLPGLYFVDFPQSARICRNEPYVFEACFFSFLQVQEYEDPLVQPWNE
eukprot:2906436-Amphidinium_carterae.1